MLVISFLFYTVFFFKTNLLRSLHNIGSPDRHKYDSYSTLLCTGV